MHLQYPHHLKGISSYEARDKGTSMNKITEHGISFNKGLRCCCSNLSPLTSWTRYFTAENALAFSPYFQIHENGGPNNKILARSNFSQ